MHSPFVFDMYRKVLFASLSSTTRRQLGLGPRDRKYHELVYKMHDHYNMEVLCYDDDEAVLSCNELGEVKVVCRPHRNKARELRWQSQQQNHKYNVSIDMYDVGMLLSYPKMKQRQHFVLK
ncbi:MAG: hypothetical protein KBT28_01170 [Bacteroidales bacterium]|nr:hypothetical protein [Candidatus Colimorpha merdihippi]